MQSKRCYTCKETKPLTEFHVARKSPDGRQGKCKACCQLYRDANKEKNRLYSLARYAADPEAARAKANAYHLAHPEAHRARSKAWNDAHPEQLRARNKAWAKANPAKTLAAKKRWLASHPGKEVAYVRKWQKAHPQQTRAINSRYSARKRGASIIDLTDAQWEEIKAAYDFRCVYCPPDCWRCRKKKHALTQDHITPISEGGNHTASNIVPACQSCNSKKHAGPPPIPVQPLLLTVAPSQPKKQYKPRKKLPPEAA